MLKSSVDDKECAGIHHPADPANPFQAILFTGKPFLLIKDLILPHRFGTRSGYLGIAPATANIHR